MSGFLCIKHLRNSFMLRPWYRCSKLFHCMAIPPNMYPFYGWEISGFHLGAIMENAAINSRMKVSVHVCMHLCLCVHLGVTLLGHRTCISSKAAQVFPECFYQFILLSAMWRCAVTPHSHQHWYSHFTISHFVEYVVIYCNPNLSFSDDWIKAYFQFYWPFGYPLLWNTQFFS